MRRIIALLAVAALVLLASCSQSGPTSLRFHNASASPVTNVVIGGNAVGTVAAGAYSPDFEFGADTWVESTFDASGFGEIQFGCLVESGGWDILWDGASANRVER